MRQERKGRVRALSLSTAVTLVILAMISTLGAAIRKTLLRHSTAQLTVVLTLRFSNWTGTIPAYSMTESSLVSPPH